MTPHSSLFEPMEMPEPVAPLGKIGRNDPCWCGSGLKYKKCHLNRSQEPKINFFEHAEAAKKEFSKGYCSHPDASTQTCSTKIIKSHTIQKRGGLAAIAENGHVMSVKCDFQKLLNNRGRAHPFPIGINTASTFPGFCNKHDTELFLPIEQKNASVSKYVAFLLAYRAVAYERFQKAAALNVNLKSRSIDRGSSLEKQIFIQNIMNAQHAGLQLGLRDIDTCKSQFDIAIKNSDFSNFRYYAIEFSNVCPVCTCGAFFPEYSLGGIDLQKLGRPSSPLEHVAFSMLSMNNKTMAVFGWIGPENGPASEFCKSIATLDAKKKPSALINIAFEYSENTFMRPSWWNSLSVPAKKMISNRVLSGTGHPMIPDRTGASLRNGGDFLWDSNIVSESICV